MRDKVIVDGVEVSECLAFTQEQPHLGINCLNVLLKGGKCELNPDCCFKQLQRLKAENEELKRINTILELVTEPQRQEIEKYLDKALKLKQTLEEIKEIANEPCLDDADCETCDENCMSKDIINKINEVLYDAD